MEAPDSSVELAGPVCCRRPSQATDDSQIQATNDEATEAKATCAQLGYYQDPFVQFFAKKIGVERIQPEIQRGYYARVFILRKLVDRFLQVKK